MAFNLVNCSEQWSTIQAEKCKLVSTLNGKRLNPCDTGQSFSTEGDHSVGTKYFEINVERTEIWKFLNMDLDAYDAGRKVKSLTRSAPREALAQDEPTGQATKRDLHRENLPTPRQTSDGLVKTDATRPFDPRIVGHAHPSLTDPATMSGCLRLQHGLASITGQTSIGTYHQPLIDSEEDSFYKIVSCGFALQIALAFHMAPTS
ncbi:hypothetical protein T265_00823 [Opisthorchis viverrini]|uniref:Uncharacterized protein n=1 Tax=Opisthorchis viverrini TaxID=6198 RepID=A0A075A4W8_OPIVI|nr:hypothetical protein T265_00823 [Opisthorchis viverrini]KER33332.1 hypothetical protein T265_00823 [Opisthorchis viverrini]